MGGERELEGDEGKKGGKEGGKEGGRLVPSRPSSLLPHILPPAPVEGQGGSGSISLLSNSAGHGAKYC